MARGRRGFTLLEVLVATVLMAVAVTALLGALRASMSNASRVLESARAAALARSQMDELLATRPLPHGTPIEGRFEPGQTGGIEAGWRALVTPFEGMVLQPGTAPPAGSRILERIQLEIWWNSGGARRTFALTAYRGARMTAEDAPWFESMQEGGQAAGAP
ncbi:MAG: prepilin-type N-terminal cleavage/methylation domain-containing protein [Bryobacteraceae bacterium]|nr:prepilin-type N-terminal cleavage/methylation domain-containing protein [Bryobacteraceae bacterium]MCX7603354.1 prepilin-type N-terminal cleavage/methylation domain-containing protein [Bryobacteraceae bacterium]